jgi:hypothetical protein
VSYTSLGRARNVSSVRGRRKRFARKTVAEKPPRRATVQQS